MAGDCKRQRQSGGTLFHCGGRSRSGMIDVNRPPRQLVLEGWEIFPQIVPQAGQIGPRSGAEGFGEDFRAFGNADQMIFEQFPISGRLAIEAVRIEFGHFLSLQRNAFEEREANEPLYRSQRVMRDVLGLSQAKFRAKTCHIYMVATSELFNVLWDSNPSLTKEK